MTLLETLVALVILGLTGVGFLGAFRADARSARAAEEWVRAVDEGEAAMEAAKLGAASDGEARVQAEPWPGAPGVELVTVHVALPGGGEFVLRRLARAR